VQARRVDASARLTRCRPCRCVPLEASDGQGPSRPSVRRSRVSARGATNEFTLPAVLILRPMIRAGQVRSSSGPRRHRPTQRPSSAHRRRAKLLIGSARERIADVSVGWRTPSGLTCCGGCQTPRGRLACGGPSKEPHPGMRGKEGSRVGLRLERRNRRGLRGCQHARPAGMEKRNQARVRSRGQMRLVPPDHGGGPAIRTRKPVFARGVPSCWSAPRAPRSCRLGVCKSPPDPAWQQPARPRSSEMRADAQEEGRVVSLMSGSPRPSSAGGAHSANGTRQRIAVFACGPNVQPAGAR